MQIKQEAEKRLTKAMLHLLMNQIFWASLILRLKEKAVADFSAPTAWVDGTRLGYNPHYVCSLPLKELIALMAHEVLHCVLGHHLRRAGRDPKLWNKACDYAVNLLLKKHGFVVPADWLLDYRFDGMSAEQIYDVLAQNHAEQPQSAPSDEDESDESSEDNSQKETGDTDSLEDDSSEEQEGDQGESDEGEEEGEPEKAEDEKVDSDKAQDQGEDGDPGQNSEEASDDSGSGETDGDQTDQGDGPSEPEADFSDEARWEEAMEGLTPEEVGEVRDFPGSDGLEPSTEDLQQQEQEWSTALVQARKQAEAAGQGSPEIDRFVDELLEPEVPWEEVLERFLDTLCREDYDWMIPDRAYLARNLYLPALGGQTLREVVVVNDTSGSITNEELVRQCSNLSGILERYSTTIYVLYVDDAFRGCQVFTKADLPLKFEPKGGGGTDFCPAFEWVEEQNLSPVCLVYLTDLCCYSYPEKEPPYPVIWLTANKNWRYWGQPPFGEVIEI